MFDWLQFILCSAVIVICGVNLSRYGDIIAEKTQLARAWIGLILLATITSLPELITGVSSVAVAGAPDIALGDVMGSCVYNLGILALMDVMSRSRPVFQGVSRGHVLSASFGVILIATAVISITLEGIIPSIGHIGLYTPLIIAVYIIGMRAVYYYEKRAITELVDEAARKLVYMDVSKERAYLMFAVNASFIVVAATFLPLVADRIAESTGLGRTFMGSIFVAMTTSLPEVVVSISAVRMNAHDLAIGNMFGSNMFNIMVLAVDDIFYTPGPLFSDVSTGHITTGLIAIVMTGVAMAGLIYPQERKTFLRAGWDAIVIIVLWLINIYILYMTRPVA